MKKTVLFLLVSMISFTDQVFAKLDVKDLMQTRKNSGFDCFNVNSIRNWRVIDRKHIVISTTKKKQIYLLRLKKPCDFLDYTNALTLISKTQPTCDNDFSRLVDLSSKEFCDVRDIFQLDAKLAKELLDAEKNNKKS